MRLSVAFLVLLSACGAEPATTPDPVLGPPLPGRENQGRTILGGLDTITSEPYWVSSHAKLATGDPVSVRVAGSELVVQHGPNVYAGTDPEIIGLSFDGVDGRELRIVNIVATPNAPLRYYLAHDGADPCGGEGAVAFAGRFDVDARHHAPANDLSFACESGEAYKCTDWGYIAGDDPASQAWGLHGACTYMAGARYCADRTSFTREGTQVAMFDVADIRVAFPPDWTPPMTWTPWTLASWPPPPDEFYIEAAWRADAPPICLSKARWASLPLDPCGTELPDPRSDPDAHYCEELASEGRLTPNDVLLVNTSLYNDLPFDIWRGETGDLLGTIRGFHDADADHPHPQPPYPRMEYVGHSGVLLRALTSELDVTDLVRLNQYCVPETNKCVVTSAGSLPPTTSHTADRGPEGYVFVTERPRTRLLKLWYRAATDDYVSAIGRPGPAYVSVAELGYILQRAPE